MKQETLVIFSLLFLSIIPFVNADIITPTTTTLYFEQNGIQYNDEIEFTVKGYGYNYSVGPPVEKEWGTYTPKVVYQFTETYQNYGSKIYENYYTNYRHIDYYKIEGKTKDGRTFTIDNIKEIPTTCEIIGSYEEFNCELSINLDDAVWNDSPNHEPTRENFWQRISSFLKRLFRKEN